MNVEFDPRQGQRLEAMAWKTGKPVGDVLRELVDEALETRAQQEASPTKPAKKAVPPALSLTGLAGIGMELWAGEDAQDHVKRLRGDWE